MTVTPALDLGIKVLLRHQAQDPGVMCEWMIHSFQTDGGEGQRARHEHPGSLLSWESCMWSLGCVSLSQGRERQAGAGCGEPCILQNYKKEYRLLLKDI